jgi:site-specific recombinase XerD
VRHVTSLSSTSDADYGRNGHEYLTPEQVEAPVKAARTNRHGLRDALMISLAWHHGFRVSEVVDLGWSAIDWKRAYSAVTRIKNGKDTRQPLDGPSGHSITIGNPTNTCLRGPMTRDGFAKLLKTAAAKAGIENAHPHALRHASGHASP